MEMSPPRSPLLMTYGDDFAEFIEAFPPARSVPYLGDIARLEAARTRAYHAADAVSMGVDELAALGSRGWANARVVLHPSIRGHFFRLSDCDNLGSTSRSDRARLDRRRPIGRRAGPRPNLAVEIYRLAPGGAVFVSELVKRSDFRGGSRSGGGIRLQVRACRQPDRTDDKRPYHRAVKRWP